MTLKHDDTKTLTKLTHDNKLIASHMFELTKIANTHIYQNTNLEYYESGENMFVSILNELKKAKRFIFLEFFIIEEGLFWNSILEILKQKASEGVEVKVVYDDIGCMATLPGNYYKQLKKYNIDAVLFSKLKGQADGEFNNRSHRKFWLLMEKSHLQVE